MGLYGVNRLFRGVNGLFGRQYFGGCGGGGRKGEVGWDYMMSIGCLEVIIGCLVHLRRRRRKGEAGWSAASASVI